MTETPTAGSQAAPAKSLPARCFGVIFAPRATYAAVAARPRWFGVFAVVVLVSASTAVALLATEIGRSAVIDQQIAQREAYGSRMTQQQIDQVEKMAPYFMYFAPAFSLLGLGVGGLLVAGVAFAIFNAMLGGDATFTQTYAVVAHSGIILAAASLFTTPLAYARESLSGTTNLAVFLPFLEETSFLARLLGSIDLIFIWWIVSLSIGLGVLYQKRTGPIAISLLAVYAAIGVIIAAIKTASTGV